MEKVLFVATVVKTHIMEFHVPYLKMFQQHGWETAVAAKNDFEDPADCVIPYCDRYYPVNFSRFPVTLDNLRAYRQLKKIIDDGDFSVIHCHTPAASVIARFAAAKARRKGTRVIYTAHGFHFFKGAPMRNWLLYFPAEWLASFFTDVLITINREDYAFAKKHMHPGRVEYVKGVGVDLNQYGLDAQERNAARKELGIDENDFLLLSVAELTPNKNQEMILRALTLLPDQRIKFVSAGRGETMERMRALTKELNLEDRVQFLGYRNDVERLYGAADAFVFPSFREGLSVALMEAMASGLPCIVGKIRGNVDLIDDGVEGLYTEHSPQAIADAVSRLVSDEALCRRCGDAAREKVKQFSSVSVEAAMEQVYFG